MLVRKGGTVNGLTVWLLTDWSVLQVVSQRETKFDAVLVLGVALDAYASR